MNKNGLIDLLWEEMADEITANNKGEKGEYRTRFLELSLANMQGLVEKLWTEYQKSEMKALKLKVAAKVADKQTQDLCINCQHFKMEFCHRVKSGYYLTGDENACNNFEKKQTCGDCHLFFLDVCPLNVVGDGVKMNAVNCPHYRSTRDYKTCGECNFFPTKHLCQHPKSKSNDLACPNYRDANSDKKDSKQSQKRIECEHCKNLLSILCPRKMSGFNDLQSKIYTCQHFETIINSEKKDSKQPREQP
jgi:hypothetical protein